MEVRFDWILRTLKATEALQQVKMADLQFCRFVLSLSRFTIHEVKLP